MGNSIMGIATDLIVGTIGIVVVAAVIATTNSQVIGSTAFTVLGFVTVGLAVALLIRAFKGGTGG